MKLIIIFLACIFFIFYSNSQVSIIDIEKGVSKCLLNLRLAKNDKEKLKLNQKLIDTLKYALKHKDAFDYNFSSLKSMGTIKSPDKKFRLFNWNIEMDDNTQKYYCLILLYDKRKNKYKIVELQDNSFLLPPNPENTLTISNWYGALYYTIIPKKIRGKTYYTLLGYDANNKVSTLKIIDVFVFNGTRLKIGAPIFLTEKGISKRLFFEFSKKATMTLQYNKNRDMIIFDHLSPESENLKDFREYYVPDFSYDALVFSNGKWIKKEDVIATNSVTNKKIKVYSKNKSGEFVKKEVDGKWINPSDSKTPSNNGKHVAIIPKIDANSQTKKNLRKKKKENNKNLYPSPYSYSKKNKRKKSIYKFK